MEDEATEVGAGEQDETEQMAEAEVAIEEDVEGRSQEVQEPRIARSPREPTSAERQLHEVTHIPYRSWCRHCARVRGKDTYHMRIAGEQEVPRVGMDYMYMSERGVTSKPEDPSVAYITLLVVKDFWHKSVWTYPVEGKGVAKAAWLPDMLIKDFNTCGLDGCMLVLKSDQEPAIRELQEEIARRRRQTGSVGTVIENSKVGDSSSNGRTERAVQEVGGLVRTLKFALEERTGGDKLALDHPILPWLAKHAAARITRYQVRANGRTSYHNIKGCSCRDPLAEFGESVLFRPPKTNKEVRNKDALSERFLDGIWIGTDIRTSANIIATNSGVYFAGKITRKVPSERWSRTEVDAIRGCPQEPVPGQGGEIPSFVRPELRGEDRVRPPAETLPIILEDYRTLPMYVRKTDVAIYGRTPGCPGCRDVVMDKPHCRPHDATCRERMGLLLRGTEEGQKRVQAAEDRLVQATVRRSDIIFAENEEKKRRTSAEPQVAEETALTGGSMGSGTSAPSPAAVSAGSDGAASRKRRPSVDIRDLDPNAGDTADAPTVVEERTGTKRQAETAISDIDPRAGDGADISLADASAQRGTMPGAVLGGQSGQRATASPQRGSIPGGVVCGSGRRLQRHGPERRIFGNRVPRDELEWRQIGSGMWARTFIGMGKLITTTKSGPCEADVLREGRGYGQGDRRLPAGPGARRDPAQISAGKAKHQGRAHYEGCSQMVPPGEVGHCRGVQPAEDRARSGTASIWWTYLEARVVARPHDQRPGDG